MTEPGQTTPEAIDAHQHVWRLDRGDYGWIAQGGPALAALARDFTVDDYESQMRSAPCSRSVLVQAAPTDSETDFLLSLAHQDDRIAGVVGWIDLSSPAAAERIDALAACSPALKSLRPMLQDLPEDDWIAMRPRPDAMAAYARSGLAFDALVMPRHLPALRAFADAWPELPIVIDHMAKPRLAEGWRGKWRSQWAADLAALAARPRTYCKLSGLLTEAPRGAGSSVDAAIEAVAPVVEFALERFGPSRLMWGSDWPVVTLAAAPSVWIEASRRLLAPLAAYDRAAIFGGVAAQVYRLPPSIIRSVGG